MKKDHVPQDDDKILEDKFKVVKYAVNENGEYEQVPTVGWEPENVALNQVWDEINQDIEDTRQKVANGKLSPIAYFMKKNLMDEKLLASHVGLNRFLVKWHLRPRKFRKLKRKTLARYADVFNISVDELVHMKTREE